MKVIKYNLYFEINRGTKENPQIEEILAPKVVPWNEVAEEIAKEEAHNGEYTIEDYNVEKTPTEQIAELKEQLSATDYKIIKCSECQLVGEEMPYNIVELHIERQAIRNEINNLEQSL